MTRTDKNPLSKLAFRHFRAGLALRKGHRKKEAFGQVSLFFCYHTDNSAQPIRD